MRKFLLLAILCGIVLNYSCKKSVASNTGTSISFEQGGLSNFDLSAINYTGDTTVVNFSVIMSPAAIKENATITLEINDAARVAYNSTSTSLLYDSLPDSCYSFAVQAVTINAGSVSVNFAITFYHLRINPKISYMLPVSITDAEGLAITDSLQTIYFHVNGNFLSASYNDVGTKTEYSGGSSLGTVMDVIQCPAVKFFSATAPSVSAVDYADLGPEGWEYLVTVDSLTNTLVSVVPNSNITGSNGVQPLSFVVDTATYNYTAGTFHFVTHYMDMSGNLRVVNETLTKQQ